MTILQDLVRVIVIAIVLSAVDAISGRVFHASVNPSAGLFLGAPGWVAYRLALGGAGRWSWVAALILYAVYIASFTGSAALLVGWNRAVPWYPRSGAWLLNMGAWVFAIAFCAQLMGARARMIAELRGGSSPDAEDDGLF